MATEKTENRRQESEFALDWVWKVDIIGRATGDRIFRQKSGDRSQESELVLAGIVVLGFIKSGEGRWEQRGIINYD